MGRMGCRQILYIRKMKILLTAFFLEKKILLTAFFFRKENFFYGSQDVHGDR